MRIVLDTNILISAIGWGGKTGKILEFCIEKKLNLFLSNKILFEVNKVLSRKKFDKIESKHKKEFILFLKEISTIVKPQKKVNICRDINDNMFIETAIEANANFIISGDEDLLSLKIYNGIEIINTNSFLEKINFDK
jgi:uncharacterized protein